MILHPLSAERAAVAQHDSSGAVTMYTLLSRRCYKGKRLVTSSPAVPTSRSEQTMSDITGNAMPPRRAGSISSFRSAESHVNCRPMRAGKSLELITSSRVLKTSGGPFVVRMWYLHLDVIPFTKTVYAACGWVSAMAASAFNLVHHFSARHSMYAVQNSSFSIGVLRGPLWRSARSTMQFR